MQYSTADRLPLNLGRKLIHHKLGEEHLSSPDDPYIKMPLHHFGAKASVYMEHPETKDVPLQQACKKGLVKGGLPLVTTILEHCGDLRIDRVEQLKDPASTDVLIKAYTTLSNKQLSRCISRALLKYDYDRKASRYPDSGNPLLACINLAKVVRDKWRQVRRSDPNYCNALNSLFNNLRLGGAYILEEMYKDQDGVASHGEM